MDNENKYKRLLLKDKIPNEEDICNTIGETNFRLWKSLKKYIEDNYEFLPEVVFGGKNYGWLIRYRKSGRTFCSLFPEYSAFTILIVLGRKEVDKTLSIIDDLHPYVKEIIINTPQLHDGKWLWIRVEHEETIEDIKKLLMIKKSIKRK